MASENKRRFEVRLHKLGIILLVCSISVLLFAFFLFGVVVGNNLDTYPEKISRQLPVQILQWCGLLEHDKAVSTADKHNEKQPAEEAKAVPDIVVRHVQPAQEKASSTKETSPRVKQGTAASGVTPPSPARSEKKTGEELKSSKEAQGNKYFVQVTSCKDKKIAEDVVVKIAKIGFKAQITMVDLKEKGIWYRVTLPPCDSQSEAAESAKKVDHILKGNQSVVRVQKR